MIVLLADMIYLIFCDPIVVHPVINKKGYKTGEMKISDKKMSNFNLTVLCFKFFYLFFMGDLDQDATLLVLSFV